MKDTTDERLKHPQRTEFMNWFIGILYATESCFDRDVLRDCKEELFDAYLIRANREPNENRITPAASSQKRS